MQQIKKHNCKDTNTPEYKLLNSTLESVNKKLHVFKQDVSIKCNAKIIAQGLKSKNSHFFKLTPYIGATIATYSGKTTIELKDKNLEKKALEIITKSLHI
jgi:hypothetical protein